MATKKGPTYRCTECGWTTVKWVGRCGECQAWGTVDEVGGATTRTAPAARVERPALPIRDVDGTRASHRGSGVPEFDRVLGGGLVPGSVVLVAGELAVVDHQPGRLIDHGQALIQIGAIVIGLENLLQSLRGNA